MKLKAVVVLAVIASSVLSGCETMQQRSDEEAAKLAKIEVGPPAELAPPPPPPKLDPTAEKEQMLSEALEVYERHKYDEAIELLTPLVGATELPLSSKIKVLKYLAFSYCVTGRTKQGRQQFDLALELDPTFQLTEAEKGHPMWSGEFQKAKQASQQKLRTKKKG